MSNVIPFASAKSVHAQVVRELLVQPPRHSHVVQFYDEPSAMFETVARFLGAGLIAGDRLLIVVSPAHRTGILAALGEARATPAIATGQLAIADADATLARFLVDGMPDPARFNVMVDEFMACSAGRDPVTGVKPRVRAFGEMVDLLWRRGNARAAIRLEELWCEAATRHEFALLCAYVMGNFYREGDTTQFVELCRQHSHVIPCEVAANDNDPHTQLRELGLLQQRARALASEVEHRKQLEVALRDALRERARTEKQLRATVLREHDARVQAEQSDAFKELFLGMLGHDLRNPLNTILTTARLMSMRGELVGECRKWVTRMESSGVRMQRMIDQILDVTRDRLASGIPTLRGDAQDLVPLVSKIIEEIRVAHPLRSVDLEAAGPCLASVDGDRLEQVVSNLIGNAIAHGDPTRPIHVFVGAHKGVARIAVHNYGPAIAPEFIGALFDPFRRAGKLPGASAGLGLGLYISERIIQAHGGRIEVTSSAAHGTLFEATFPTAPELLPSSQC